MTTHRKANVEIVNETGAPIRAVSVVHKYSDNYVNHHVWDAVGAGAVSSAMQVDYNTGALTTGRDWWMVAWVAADGRSLRHTNPHNLRDILDVFESVAPGVAAVLGTVATIESAGWGGAAGAAIVAPFVNSSKTSGFKQHILRAEDHVTKIRIRGDKVEWDSPSGRSATGVATTKIPVHAH